MAATKDSAYVTLLTNESYLPGALTLGKKLKTDLKTTYKLIILLDQSALSDHSLDLIKDVYDEIIPIDDKLINAPLEKVLQKLGREELSITFSKLLLWNQHKYETLIYLDSDTLPLKPLDSLFDTFQHLKSDQIVASPDSGWPDIFNSGVLILKPDPTIFNKLIEFSSTENSTFDGADQGLLNEFFNISSSGLNWLKLPYLFNVTPNYTNAYQYYPALLRFFDNIHLLHYIGASKPWHAPDILSSDLNNFHNFWWADFNKFYTTDIKTKLLSLPKGEAYNLKFGKYSNVWDTGIDPNFITNLPSIAPTSIPTSNPPIFPWEHKEERQPTRTFSESNDPPAYLESTSTPSEIETLSSSLSSSKISKDNIKSPPLSQSYGFDKSSQNKSFNPEKSLDEVSKLPLKFLSKHKQQKDEK
ncbi:glycogenin glucosyltransferase [Scheffersomyces coipomensis]|uniref:glycogenin glucosyltransferase n=1 Tax=Scheffersomyces coipomensis TaxID=1788519 RepID=UPI00315DA9A5